MSNATKYFFVFCAFVAWGFFVYQGMTPTAEYIQALREVLLALGVYHATLTKPGA